jgi:hypothetical protein
MKPSSRVFEVDFSSNKSVFNIVSSLFHRFHNTSKGYSAVTSSFWQDFGENTKVENSQDAYRYLMGGLYAGDYENRKQMSLIDLIKNFPVAIFSYLVMFTLPREWRLAVGEVAVNSQRIINPDFVRIAKSCAKLVSVYGPLSNRNITIIGDGYGTCGSLIRSVYPSASILYVNLGKSLVFDISFCFQVFPNSSHSIPKETINWKEGGFQYIPAEDLNYGNLKADVYIAMQTFQEMNLDVIQKYFSLMRSEEKSPLLYSANRTVKILPDGTIIRNKDYGWSTRDTIFSKRTPWWLYWCVRRRPPFLFHMDGKIEETIALIARD